jgi:methylated-DNA-[protein]-cysteine S-methyltransferase
MLPKPSSFSEEVKAVVRQIPPGETMTYKAVAKAIGKPSASRAVARVMSKNYDNTVPCHRVIKSDGSLGGYNRGGSLVKAKILNSETLRHTKELKSTVNQC